MTEYENGWQIEKLAGALAEAQGEFTPVTKTGDNPHLHSRYLTLDQIITTVRPVLARHGLAFVQLLQTNSDGALTLRTLLLHDSGQYLASEVAIADTGERKGVNALQALGGNITYMKRYALSAMLGIAADEDDDGHSGSAPPTRRRRQGGGQAEAPVEESEDVTEARARVAGAVEGDDEAKALEAVVESAYNPQSLLKAVNHATSGYYNGVPHMLNAWGKVAGAKQAWPTDAVAYPAIAWLLIDHALASQAAKASQAD